MNFVDRVDKYLNDVAALLNSAPREDIRNVVNLVMDAYRSGQQVFVLGNGGSASTASHLACDLQKTIGLYGDRQFKVMGLTDSIPLMTAWANDFDYSEVFARQLATWLNPGDLVIAISGSGNSPNVIKAMEYANEHGAVTIGLSGFQGGRLAQVAQHNIIVPSENMQHLEDVHMVFCHLIFRYLFEEITA
jgi:D-sedoheptulose 7-phosphate isomerase